MQDVSKSLDKMRVAVIWRQFFFRQKYLKNAVYNLFPSVLNSRGHSFFMAVEMVKATALPLFHLRCVARHFSYAAFRLPRVTVVTVESCGWRSWILPAPKILRMSNLRCFSVVTLVIRVPVTRKWVTVERLRVTVTLSKRPHCPSAFCKRFVPLNYCGAVYRESAQNAAQANVGHLWAYDARNENAWMIQKNVGLREGSLLRASIAFGSPHSGPPNAAGRGVPRTPHKKKKMMPWKRKLKSTPQHTDAEICIWRRKCTSTARPTRLCPSCRWQIQKIRRKQRRIRSSI